MSEKPVASINTLARYEPDTVYIGTGEYVAECVRADDGDYYLAADVDAALEALHTEIERLWWELEDWKESFRQAAYAAERLVEALETCLEIEGRPRVIEFARAAVAAAKRSQRKE